MLKTILIAIGIVVVVAGGWYLIDSNSFTSITQPATNSADNVAVVNGEAISRADLEVLKTQTAAQQGVDLTTLDVATMTALETQIVEDLISQALIRQAVEAAGIQVPTDQLDAQLADIRAQFGEESEYQAALVAEGLTEVQLRERISAGMATDIYLQQELDFTTLSASDEEIQATYSQALTENPQIPPLEEVRDQVQGAVIQQKQQAMIGQLIQSLRQQAQVEILL
ncbi:MAG: SurA N-terminal domain-containing protein [Candidatus Komeilibacteria bacterium]|nr:SurA N-terminal domain-containing protein [Candidatus Komeilibacteria bacterium]